jgi:RimJ/RimL family protein N-acetyltransferase
MAKWTARRISYVDDGPANPFGECECVGVERDRRLIACVVFNMWDPLSRTLTCSMAADTPMWARPEVVTDILDIPFRKLQARKLYTMIRSDNLRVIKLNKHLGFKEEGRLSEHFGPRLHAVVLAMKRHHYDRLRERLGEHRQGRERAAA